MQSSGFTFDVEPGIQPSGPGSYGKNPHRLCEPAKGDSLCEAWQKMGGTIEAMSPAPNGTVAVFTKQNLFAKAVHSAFFDHHPLILSPDVIWLTICQGLAHHVDQNSKKLREFFVPHQGKKELVISRPSFVKGSPHNDWESVFPEFSELIKENSVVGTTELIQNDFSTTGCIERIVSHITLMDAVQHYLSYTMCCGCGFPSITLSGTPEDWEKVRSKAEQLRKFDLDWWLGALLPVLDQFVRAAHGWPDLDFWRSLCMIDVGTSFPQYKPLTGWVQVFFPYLISPGHEFDGFSEADGKPKKKLRRNSNLESYLESYRSTVNASNFGQNSSDEVGVVSLSFWDAPRPKGTGDGVDLELFPPGMSSAPFTYQDMLTRKGHEMGFFGGVTCLVQHANGAIEPKLGWAVLDSGREKLF